MMRLAATKESWVTTGGMGPMRKPAAAERMMNVLVTMRLRTRISALALLISTMI